MGTDLENVIEDINALMEHLKYFAECRGNLTPKIRGEIDIHIESLKRLANLIEQVKKE